MPAESNQGKQSWLCYLSVISTLQVADASRCRVRGGHEKQVRWCYRWCTHVRHQMQSGTVVQQHFSGPQCFLSPTVFSIPTPPASRVNVGAKCCCVFSLALVQPCDARPMSDGHKFRRLLTSSLRRRISCTARCTWIH
jgi:hypothetical protein